MALYDLPGGRRYADLPLDVTVRLSLRGLSEDCLELLANQRPSDRMGVCSSVVESGVDLKTRRDISNMMIILNSLYVSPQEDHACQSLWFQSSLDGFRGISYVGPFVHYCTLAIAAYKLPADSLYVGEWGTGENAGKDSVLFCMHNVGFPVIADAMAQIVQAIVPQ